MNAVQRALRFAAEFRGAGARFRSLHGSDLERWHDAHGAIAARFALARSSFWRRRAAGLRPEEWRAFPVVDKAAVMAEFDDFNTAGVSADEAVAHALAVERGGDPKKTLRGLTVGLSSGTSGRRTISLLSPDEQAGFAGFMLSRLLDGVPLLRRRRIAFFMRVDSNAYAAASSPLLDYRFFPLDLDEAALVDGLRRLRPDILLAPPAMLDVIAGLVDAGALDVRPEVVFSVAEVLEPQRRARLEAVFGVVVRDVYHTSEGLLGVACRRGRLHIPEDVTHVELEPLGDNRFTPIQTQLFRRVLPFLRYRMNDVVTVDDAGCDCGSAFRVLAAVEGRCDDVFFLQKHDGGWKRVFPDNVRRAVLAEDGVREYRAVQEAADHIVVSVDVDGAFDEAAFRARLLSLLGVDGCVVPRVDVVRGVAVDEDKRKKRVRVRRRFADPTQAPTTNSTTQREAA